MVTRKQTPEGKRVTMGVKFSEPEAAMIDTARGTTTRSEWLRTAALAYLAGAPRPLRTTSKGREKVTLTEIATFEPAPGRTPANCKHPNFRGVKGVCPDCCEWVAGKPKT